MVEHNVDVTQEDLHVRLASEGTVLFEPGGVAEMMQRNERLDAAFAQVKELFPVALEYVVVVAAGLGLHAGPLHADARDLQSEVAHELVVFPPAAPVVGGGVRGGAVLGDPFAPVVGARRSFDL